MSKSCPSVARAILGALDAPDGVLLRCGLLAGHEGHHTFHMEWSDPPAEADQSRLLVKDIESYLGGGDA